MRWKGCIFLAGISFLFGNHAQCEYDAADIAAFFEAYRSSDGFTPCPFWKSMQFRLPATDKCFIKDAHIQIVEKNFNQFCLKSSKSSSTAQSYSIPPVVHFIWLGSEIPEKVRSVIQSWELCNPGWKIQIWTDEKIEGFTWSSPHSKLAFEQGETWAEKSDILRYEILYQMGGVYSDTDVVCLKSLHDLISNDFTFFAGIEVNEVYRNHGFPLYVGTAVMGSARASSVMKYCIDHFLTEEDAPLAPLVIRSGPGLLSRACLKELSFEGENILIFPCSYFYPLPYLKHWIPFHMMGRYISPESFTVHLWDGSWLPKSY